MEIKKNPKADISRYSLLFFQIGMVLMLFFAWRGVEWKSFDRADLDGGLVLVSDLLDEEIPITDLPNTPPPPPPPPAAAISTVIVEIEDEAEIEETIIESSELNQNSDIAAIEEIEEGEVEEEEIVDVPFAVIENVPIYPGCENQSSNADKKECMSKKIEQFVISRFDTSLAGELGLEGRQRISVQFKIDKNGDVTGVRARAPHPKLEEEAVRVVRGLPKMIPGKQRGKAVGVLYALPIIFQVEI
jgi:protein TonB